MPTIRPDQNPQPATPPEHSSPTPVSSSANFDNLPMEMYHYFQVNPVQEDNYTRKQLKDIYRWAGEGAEGEGDKFLKIRNLEMKLGAPHLGETRHTKLYNWLRIYSNINSIHKEREMQIKRTVSKKEAEINRIKKENEAKLKQLERQKNAELQAIKKSHLPELRQLDRLKRAYERG